MKLKIVILAGWACVDSRAADNFGFLVCQHFSLGNIVICREKNYSQEFLGF